MNEPLFAKVQSWSELADLLRSLGERTLSWHEAVEEIGAAGRHTKLLNAWQRASAASFHVANQTNRATEAVVLLTVRRLLDASTDTPLRHSKSASESTTPNPALTSEEYRKAVTGDWRGWR